MAGMDDVYDGEADGRGIGAPDSGRGINYWIAFGRARYGQPNLPGGGGGIGILFIFVTLVWLIWRAAFLLLPLLPDVAFVAVVWAAAAAIASALVYGISRVLARGASMPYSVARETSATAVWQYIALTVGMRILVGWYSAGLPSADHLERVFPGAWQTAMTTVRHFSASADVSMFAALPADRWLPLVGLLLVIRGPGILMFARRLSRCGMFREPYRPFLHFVAAVPVAIVAIEASLSAAVWTCLALLGRVRMVPLATDNRLTLLVFYSAILVLPCAFIGALPGGVIVRAITRWLETQRIASFGRSYSTAVRALLAYGSLTVLAVFLFREADDWVWWLARQISDSEPRAWTSSPSVFARPFAALLMLQLPGLLAAGALVARKFGVYDGFLGYLRACMTAGIMCVTVFGSALIAAHALPGIVAWVNAQSLP